MNNPHNLPPEERAITPNKFWGKGINFQMSAERRKKKHDRHKANAPLRQEQSRNDPRSNNPKRK